jgi:hypothetical protein
LTFNRVGIDIFQKIELLSLNMFKYISCMAFWVVTSRTLVGKILTLQRTYLRVEMCSMRDDWLAYGSYKEIYELKNDSFQGHNVFFLSEEGNGIV